jgi:putative tricarboxylic transport membrane protein
MGKKTVFCMVLLSALLGIFAVASVTRAAYPENPVEIIVHSSPGGGSDLFARAVAHNLEAEKIVNQKIQVVNRTGGGGTVALNYLASKKGDPYTLMNVTTSPLSALIRGSSKMKFEDLTLIAMLMEDPNLAFTRYDSPFKDMQAVIAEARKAPKKVNVAIGNIGGSEHICAHRVAKAAGVEFNIVSFQSGGEAAVALLGGHVDISFGNINEQMGQIEAKKVRPLAIMTEKRVPYLPDVPTMKEIGIDAEFSQIRGFWGPQDFPASAVTFWENAFAKFIQTKGFKEMLSSNQAVENFMKHEEFKKFLVKYLADLQKDVKELEIYQEKKK